MQTRSNKIFVLLFLLSGLITRPARAQNLNASITGVVSDPAGALVPHVRLTLRALTTQAISRTMSDSTGLYSFPSLPAGAYELSAQAPGFRDFVQTGIILRINENVRLDIKLQLGEARQT